jgi:hypothetical protein
MPVSAWVRQDHFSAWAFAVDILAFFLCTISIGSFYVLSQKEGKRKDWVESLWEMPMTLTLGVGMSLNQTRAVLAGLFSTDMTFVRTPKKGDNKHKEYKVIHANIEWFSIAEVFIGLYCLLCAGWLISENLWQCTPFLFLFGSGYLYVGMSSTRLMESG